MPDALDRWTRLVTLFEDALERPPDERTAWLRAACGDDPALYAEVEAMLDGHGRELSILDGSAADALGPDSLDDALAPAIGERVGPWVLDERIGTGGMGAVYRAHRADTSDQGGFDQTAALKRLKPGMDSEAVLDRFRAERQILARLDHPGIARLLDGGLDDRGRPYFAMELVDGEPITDAADARRLTVRERLGLFAEACDAVAYAHQNLVVHRDLKPSNVLVASGDAGQEARGKGHEDRSRRVKLLDFGIAKVLSDDADDGLTRTGHRVLTPAFAAPEQVRGEAPTTATDVYALGGLLYRLLCGAAPLDTGGTRAEAERAVLEGTPEKPSTRVTAEAATARSTTAEALERRLRGDLDVICLTALRTEPERRYGSAAELAADVRRHLDGLPVAARPATARYRAGLFVKRHRAGVLATSAAVVAIAAVTAIAFGQVADERDRATAETRRATEVVGFLQDLLLGASPYEEPGEELTARELVDRGAERIAQLDGEPETQANLQTLIGRVYFDLGRADAAEPLFRGAYETRTALGLSEAAAVSARDLGRALRDLDNTDDAERWLRASLDALTALPDAAPVEVALSERHLGSLVRDQGDYEGAETLYRRALARVRPVLDPDDEIILDITTSLVIALRALDRTSEAADLMAEVVASDRRTLPPDHPNLAGSIATHSGLLARAGRGAEAVAAAQEADRIFRAAHPDADHPNLASSRLGLAIALEADGQLAEADRAHADAVARMRAAHGPGDSRALNAVRQHAALKETLGDADAAAALYREAAADASAYPRTAGLLWSSLADNRARAGAVGEAERAYRRAVAVLDAEGLTDDLESVAADYAAALREGGRPDLAAAVADP